MALSNPPGTRAFCNSKKDGEKPASVKYGPNDYSSSLPIFFFFFVLSHPSIDDGLWFCGCEVGAKMDFIS